MPTEQIVLKIDGMHCDGCVRRVRKLLEMAGATEIRRVEIGSAELAMPADGADASTLTQALNKAGFVATVSK